MPLDPGLIGSATVTITEAHLATTVRSGDVPVYATPMVVALCEEATVAAVSDGLEPGLTTVGVRVDLEHLGPSVTGATVVATATLRAVDGRRLTFDVTVEETGRVIARGTIDRMMVDRARFMGRLGLD